jgi:hypothetical protein
MHRTNQRELNRTKDLFSILNMVTFHMIASIQTTPILVISEIIAFTIQPMTVTVYVSE